MTKTQQNYLKKIEIKMKILKLNQIQNIRKNYNISFKTAPDYIHMY